eukprot:9607144-Prorocentrum_lima.AAC.1
MSWNDEVFCNEWRTPLVPANKVIHSFGLIQYTSGKKEHCGSRMVKVVNSWSISRDEENSST